MYREEQSGAGFMMGVLTGAFVGAGIALLFAPRAGTEMRQQLGDQYRGIADRVGTQTQGLRERANQLRDQGRERLQQMKGQTSDRTTSGADASLSASETGTSRFPSSAPTV